MAAKSAEQPLTLSAANDRIEPMLHFFCTAAKVGFKFNWKGKFMTYGEVLPIWWSMVWRGFLAGTATGFVVGFIVGFVGAMLGKADAASFWGGIAGLIVAIPVSLWAMRAAINKHQLRPAQTST